MAHFSISIESTVVRDAFRLFKDSRIYIAVQGASIDRLMPSMRPVETGLLHLNRPSGLDGHGATDSQILTAAQLVLRATG